MNIVRSCYYTAKRITLSYRHKPPYRRLLLYCTVNHIIYRAFIALQRSTSVTKSCSYPWGLYVFTFRKTHIHVYTSDSDRVFTPRHCATPRRRSLASSSRAGTHSINCFPDKIAPISGIRVDKVSIKAPT